MSVGPVPLHETSIKLSLSYANPVSNISDGQIDRFLFVLQVVDFYNFEDIGEVSTIKSSALQLVMHTGGRVVVTTNKAGNARTLWNRGI